MSEPLKDAVDERGIPTKSDYPGLPIPVLYMGFNTVLLCIGLGIAFAVYSLGATAKYDKKIDALAAGDFGWVYLGVVALKCTILCININLGMSRKLAKVNVPDQQVYKVHVPEGQAELGYVLMEKEGVLGAFNRAQRGLQNFFEQLPMFLALFAFAGYAFPFPSFVCCAIWGVCRVLAAVGYTNTPKGRMPGNILGMFTMEALTGFVLLAGVKAIVRAE